MPSSCLSSGMRRRRAHLLSILGLIALVSPACAPAPVGHWITDGGDRHGDLALDADGNMTGIEAEDTVGRYSTGDPDADATARSNRVRVDAPRYVMLTSAVAPEVSTGSHVAQADQRLVGHRTATANRTSDRLGQAFGSADVAADAAPDLVLVHRGLRHDAGSQIAGEDVGEHPTALTTADHAGRQLQTAAAVKGTLGHRGPRHQSMPTEAGQIHWAFCASETAVPVVSMLLDTRASWQRLSGVDRLDGIRNRSQPSRLARIAAPAHDAGQLTPERHTRLAGALTGIGRRRPGGTQNVRAPGLTAVDENPQSVRITSVPVLATGAAQAHESVLVITPWRVISQRQLAALSRAEQFAMVQRHQVVTELSRPAYPRYIHHAGAASETHAVETPGVVDVSRAPGTVLARPDLGNLLLVKTVDRTAATHGTILTFTIAFRNVGAKPLARVVVVDSLHQRLRYVPDSARASVQAEVSTEPNDVGSTLVRWALAEPVEPGQQGRLAFQARVVAWPGR